MSTNQRIRGRELQRIRMRHFRRDPLCVMCKAKGIIRVWTQLDHVIAIENGGSDTDDNRAGLCNECHRVKTAKDMGYKEKQVIGADGWPV